MRYKRRRHTGNKPTASTAIHQIMGFVNLNKVG